MRRREAAATAEGGRRRLTPPHGEGRARGGGTQTLSRSPPDGGRVTHRRRHSGGELRPDAIGSAGRRRRPKQPEAGRAAAARDDHHQHTRLSREATQPRHPPQHRRLLPNHKAIDRPPPNHKLCPLLVLCPRLYQPMGGRPTSASRPPSTAAEEGCEGLAGRGDGGVFPSRWVSVWQHEGSTCLPWCLHSSWCEQQLYLLDSL